MNIANLGHMGDLTESIINNTNEYYLSKGLAVVTKIPTPVKVIKRKGGMIVSAFFEEKGVLDYIGVCQGLPVAFDSKETNLPSLPLSNIAEHQYNYIANFIAQDGYAFILCHFKKSGNFYVIPGEFLLEFRKESLKGGRKSIPEKELKEEYRVIYNQRRNVVDYLAGLNYYWKERELKKEQVEIG